MQRANSLEKTLMLQKIEVRRRRGWQRMRWLDGITNSMDMSLASSRRWQRTGKPGMQQSMGSQRVGHDWAIEQQPKMLSSKVSSPLLSVSLTGQLFMLVRLGKQLKNFSCKGSGSKYFKFCGHMVPVVITQLCHTASESSNRQYANK